MPQKGLCRKLSLLGVEDHCIYEIISLQGHCQPLSGSEMSSRELSWREPPEIAGGGGSRMGRWKGGVTLPLFMRGQ